MLPGWRPGLLGDLRERLATSVVLAEHREGAAAGRDDFIMLWLDDGVGSAIVLGGVPAAGGVGRCGRDRLPRLPRRVDLRPAHPRGGRPGGHRRAGSPGGAGRVPLAPGLVVLAGSTGREGGPEPASRVAGGLAALVPTEVRATAVEGDPVVKGAVATALTMARDALFGAP